VIAVLAFESRARAGVRRATFVRRAPVPLDTACVVANGVREALREVLGESCTVSMGEPVALDAAGWRGLVRDALVFAVPGRATDVAFVLARGDARTLVDAAFGEERSHGGAWSALEHGAVERIVARCATASEALCAERRGPLRAVDPAGFPACAGYFDVRITAPARFTLGVGVLRALPEPEPQPLLPPAALGAIEVEVRALLGTGTLTADRLLELQAGDLIVLRTKVAGEGELKVAGQRVAGGLCGVAGGRAAFFVRSVYPRGDLP
jgi:flagellar motor switch/type III secretory pathway protein FliN